MQWVITQSPIAFIAASCKGDQNKKFYGSGHFSYLLNPLGGRYVNKAQRFFIRNTEFVEVPNEHEIALTHYL